MEQKKKGEGTQIFEKGRDKLGQGVGSLKGGLWNPLMNYGLVFTIILEITPPIIKIDRGTKLFEKICSAINFLL